jgi:hypothetical protein
MVHEVLAEETGSSGYENLHDVSTTFPVGLRRMSLQPLQSASEGADVSNQQLR